MSVMLLLAIVGAFITAWFIIWFVYYYTTDYREYKIIYSMERWVDSIASKCKYRRENDKVSIPASKSICKLTNDVCDYNNCPLIKGRRKLERIKKLEEGDKEWMLGNI